MGWLILTLVGLAATLKVNSFHLQHPELYPEQQQKIKNLNFQRDSVESIPEQIKNRIGQQTEQKIELPGYGSKFLPLRDAVEAVPNTFGIDDAKLEDLNTVRQK